MTLKMKGSRFYFELLINGYADERSYRKNSLTGRPKATGNQPCSRKMEEI